MKNAQGIVLACAVCAGSVCSFSPAAESPTKLQVGEGIVKDVAHIYYNIASGERVVTLLGEGQSAGADNGISGAIWSARVSNPCADQGFTTNFFFGLDDNSGTTTAATNATSMNWGDVPVDTLVDCVHIDWVTDHDDVDDDSDGIGDGVVGLSGQWTFWDGENGRILQSCTRLPIVSFIFTDLPGDTSPPEDGFLAGYSADVDLAATFMGTSLIFEIGDSDGDLQGAWFGSNDIDIDSDGIGDGVSIGDTSTVGGFPLVDRDFDGLADADLDLDGLFDWGWSVRFRQPGTADLDSDGVNEGDILDSMKTIGISFGIPEGTAVDNGDTTWTWEIDTSVADAGNGSEDAFALFDSSFDYIGTFFFGGFSCAADDITRQYSPYTGFEFQLFGPSGSNNCPGSDILGCSQADFAEPFGTLNFFDVSSFLSYYNEQSPCADLSAPFGAWNFFDVSAYLGAFGAACP